MPRDPSAPFNIKAERVAAALALREAKRAFKRASQAMIRAEAEAKEAQLAAFSANRHVNDMEVQRKAAQVLLEDARARSGQAAKSPTTVLGEQLCQAVWDGAVSVVRGLLALGASPDARDSGGRSALRLAAGMTKRAPILKLLIGKGARDIPDDHGHTAMFDALAGGQNHSVELLLGAGSDPHRCDKNGCTPLILAVRNWMEPAARALAPLSDISARDRSGYSAIDYARDWVEGLEPEDFDNSDAHACLALLEGLDISASVAPAKAARVKPPRL